MPGTTSTVTDRPTIGARVVVRGQAWVVRDVTPGEHDSLVRLQSVETGRYGDSVDVIWEVEPGRRVLPTGSLPDVTADGFDPPQRLAAFLDAVRWSAVTSTWWPAASPRLPRPRPGDPLHVGPAVHQEMVDRLLELNHDRYAEEVAAGPHDKKPTRGRVPEAGSPL